MRKTLSVLLLSISCFSAMGVNNHPYNDSHDICSLPSWGPYSKSYAGISHISELSSGVRFDFSVMPGYYRRSYEVPNVLYESGYHPWRVDKDMKQICYRYELEWKDKVYVDVTYTRLDSTQVLVNVDCVNNTDIPQNILLNNVASIAYYDYEPRVVLKGAENLSVINASRYNSFTPAVKAHDYRLEYDGLLRGELLDEQSLSGRALGDFAKNVGDQLVYILPQGLEGKRCRIGLRYMLPKGQSCSLSFDGAAKTSITLNGSGRYELAFVDAKICSDELTIAAAKSGQLRLDAVIVGAKKDFEALRVEQRMLPYRPKLEKYDGAFVAKYEALEDYYALAWNFPYSEVREFENGELDVFMRRAVHRHPPKYFGGDREGDYLSAFLRPICLEAGQTTRINLLLACGTKQYVEQRIAAFHSDEAAFSGSVEANQAAPLLEQAEPYKLGQQLLQATLLTNIVYPVYTQGQYIRHFTPGKNWNSLYTWDSGFISMALADIDPVKSFETIRAYTTEESSNAAFIHHGTPLPIQFFAYSDLCNKYDSQQTIEYLYPRLKRYYDFMAGHEESSTTRMPSNLLRTWDYFYSSGGWDDYPPQHQLRSDTHLYPYVTPVVSTAYYIRAAKILRLSASRLGLDEDMEHYTRDIEAFSEALQKYSWDEQTGYFSYVMHDKNLRPCGIYQAGDGSNFNQGYDGVSPLSAGICSDEQQERLLEHIFSPEQMWTKIGVSTVDRSASYYSPNGYWNGSVWFPHQFVLWKSLLDLDKPELAHKLAFTALDLWKGECAATYNSFEHFIIASGRGAGWHNFSGLSSPLVNWFCSYFEQGKVSTGFDILLSEMNFDKDYSGYRAKVSLDIDAAKPGMLICLNPAYQYEASLNGKKIEVSSIYDGLIYLSLPASSQTAELIVRKK